MFCHGYRIFAWFSCNNLAKNFFNEENNDWFFFFTSFSRRSYSLWIISMKVAKRICFEMKHPLPHRYVSVFRIPSLTFTPSLSLSFTHTHSHTHTYMHMQIYYATKIFSLLTRQIMLDYPTCLPMNFCWWSPNGVTKAVYKRPKSAQLSNSLFLYIQYALEICVLFPFRTLFSL